MILNCDYRASPILCQCDALATWSQPEIEAGAEGNEDPAAVEFRAKVHAKTPYES
jgi:hypothetical protein